MVIKKRKLNREALKKAKIPKPRKVIGHSGMPAMDRRILQALIEDHKMNVKNKEREWAAIAFAVNAYIYRDLSVKETRKLLREANGGANPSRMQYFILWAITGDCTT